MEKVSHSQLNVFVMKIIFAIAYVATGQPIIFKYCENTYNCSSSPVKIVTVILHVCLLLEGLPHWKSTC